MKAYVYTETFTDGRVNYIVYCYNNHKNPNYRERGCSNLRTTEENRLVEALLSMNKRKDITVFVDKKLPPGVEAVEQNLVRKPYDLSSLRKRGLLK